jgi:hypothetical protein
MGCGLPVTGANIETLLMLALLLIGAGVALVWVVRRRRLGPTTAIILALAVGMMVLTTSEVRAGAQSSCPPSAPAAVPVPATTTTAGTTPTTTTTVPPTTTTTTTAPVPDLTPRFTGPTTLSEGNQGTYTYEITNLGTGPTIGPMTFTITFTVEQGTNTLTTVPLSSNDWTFSGSSGTSLTFTSNTGLVIAPGAVSTGTFGVTPSATGGVGSFEILTTLPNGIGGENDSLDNTSSLAVAITAPT